MFFVTLRSNKQIAIFAFDKASKIKKVLSIFAQRAKNKEISKDRHCWAWHLF